MKPIALQLITVKLDNGEHGIFIGSPLMANQNDIKINQISEIWFSDIRDLPDKMQLNELMAMVQAQLKPCKKNLH